MLIENNLHIINTAAQAVKVSASQASFSADGSND